MHALLMRVRAHKSPGVVRMSTAPGMWLGYDALSVGNLKFPTTWPPAHAAQHTRHTKDVRPPSRPRKPQHKGVADLYDDHGTAPFDPPDDQHAPRTGAREACAAARAPLHAYAPPPAVVRCAKAAMAPAAGCYYQGFNNNLNKNNNSNNNSSSYTPASGASSATSGELGEERTRAGDRCSSHLGFRPLFFCPGSAYFP